MTTFPSLADAAQGEAAQDILAAMDQARSVLDVATETGGSLPPVDTATALRSAVRVGGASRLTRAAGELLAPADNYGERISCRYVASLSIVLTIVFGALFLRDRARGGYRVERLESSPVSRLP